MDLKAKRIRRVCNVPGCRNTVAYILSRFRTFGNCVILCEECINDALKLVNEIKMKTDIKLDIEPLFRCPACGEEFLSQSDLDNHNCEGIQIDPYTCEECGEVFYSHNDYKNHIVSHHIEIINPNTSDADEATAEAYSVDSEDTSDTTGTADTTDNADIADTSDTTDTSDTAVVYTCDVCGKEFDSEANLKRHIAMAHKDGE